MVDVTSKFDPEIFRNIVFKRECINARPDPGQIAEDESVGPEQGVDKPRKSHRITMLRKWT